MGQLDHLLFFFATLPVPRSVFGTCNERHARTSRPVQTLKTKTASPSGGANAKGFDFYPVEFGSISMSIYFYPVWIVLLIWYPRRDRCLSYMPRRSSQSPAWHHPGRFYYASPMVLHGGERLDVDVDVHRCSLIGKSWYTTLYQ